MKTEKYWFPVVLGILCGIMVALVILAVSNYPAYLRGV